MPTYQVELYLPDGRLSDIAAEVWAAAGAVSECGWVRCDVAIAVPGDEVGFCVVEAPSSDVARVLFERARLQVVRVASAIVDKRAAKDWGAWR